jgi:hypothetical protein
MMASKSIVNMFATRADLEPGIRVMEASRRLHYVLCGLFDHSTPTIFQSLLDVPDLGILEVDDHIRGPRYLVVASQARVRLRTVPQRGGGMRYAIDQAENPASITILPGGIHQDRCVLAGQLGTIATDDQALSLFRDYSRHLTKGFTRIRGYRVGPEALELARRGVRLTTGVRSPVEYDIRP